MQSSQRARRRMNSSSRSAVGLLSCLAVTLLLANLGSGPLTEARYLPTRSDESDLVVLKDLIRLVLEEQGARVPPSRFYQQPQRQPFQMQRRSLEVPHLSSGDNDQLLRSMETRAGNQVKTFD